MWKAALALAVIVSIVGMYYFVGKKQYDKRESHEAVQPIVPTRQVDVTEGAPTAPFARASSVSAPQ